MHSFCVSLDSNTQRGLLSRPVVCLCIPLQVRKKQPTLSLPALPPHVCVCVCVTALYTRPPSQTLTHTLPLFSHFPILSAPVLGRQVESHYLLWEHLFCNSDSNRRRKKQRDSFAQGVVLPCQRGGGAPRRHPSRGGSSSGITAGRWSGRRCRLLEPSQGAVARIIRKQPPLSPPLLPPYPPGGSVCESPPRRVELMLRGARGFVTRCACASRINA